MVGKTNLDEIGGVYGVFPFLGDGTGKWTLVDNTGLPPTGRERTWGVGLADINNDGVLDIGVAFGDVLSPTGARAGDAEDRKEQGRRRRTRSKEPRRIRKLARRSAASSAPSKCGEGQLAGK